MPRARSDMRRIREVLRLRDEFGASQRQIADACRLPRSTVRDYLDRLRASGRKHPLKATVRQLSSARGLPFIPMAGVRTGGLSVPIGYWPIRIFGADQMWVGRRMST